MSTPDRRIVLGCTTCELVVAAPVADEEQTRTALSGFFDAHVGHATWIDVSQAGAGLPRARRDLHVDT